MHRRRSISEPRPGSQTASGNETEHGNSGRCGFTLMELIVAAGIIGVVFLVTIPLLAHVRSVRQEADRRSVAQQEAANVMEQVAALAMREALTPAALKELQLSRAAAILPEATLAVNLDDGDAPQVGRRVVISVGWTTDVGTTALPVMLTALFPMEGD